MNTFDLWLPTILSGVAVYFASVAASMFLPHHRRYWSKLPNEEKLLKLFADQSLPPGNYIFPHADTWDEAKSKVFQEWMRKGPRGTLSLWQEPPRIGRNNSRSFCFYLAVSFVIAYLSSIALFPGQESWQVFRFVSTAGLLAYCAALVPGAIWFQHKILNHMFKGVGYALITGLVFSLCWPQ